MFPKKDVPSPGSYSLNKPSPNTEYFVSSANDIHTRDTDPCMAPVSEAPVSQEQVKVALDVEKILTSLSKGSTEGIHPSLVQSQIPVLLLKAARSSSRVDFHIILRRLQDMEASHPHLKKAPLLAPLALWLSGRVFEKDGIVWRIEQCTAEDLSEPAPSLLVRKKIRDRLTKKTITMTLADVLACIT